MQKLIDFVINNPFLIVLIILIFTIESIVKYLRRFYPESQKKAVQEAEEFRQSLKNNKEDKKIYKKSQLKLFFFLFLPTIFLFIGYLVYNYFFGEPIKVRCMLYVFSKIFTISSVLFFIYFINFEKINKLVLQDDYEKMKELSAKQVGSDKLSLIAKKYIPTIGYFFLLLWLFSMISLYLK
jgi:hypothetical protein